MRPTIVLFLAISGIVGCANATDTKPQPSEIITSVVAHDQDIVPLHATVKVASLIVLPEKEKALGVFCGDRTFWTIDIVPGAERFISVKPSKENIQTDIHIITNFGHSYTVQALAGRDNPVDLKLFIRPADESTLDKMPTLYSAADMDLLKQQLADAQKASDEAKKQAAAEGKEAAEKVRGTYPAKLRFDYRFDKDRKPFHVQQIWTDGAFTYIRAYPEEAAALYAVKDGKPSLVEYQFADGLYTVPTLISDGYLAIGKQKLGFVKISGDRN